MSLIKMFKRATGTMILPAYVGFLIGFTYKMKNIKEETDATKDDVFEGVPLPNQPSPGTNENFTLGCVFMYEGGE